MLVVSELYPSGLVVAFLVAASLACTSEHGAKNQVDELSVATTTTDVYEKKSSPEESYQRYCALCHGVEREGYANDNAPSLRTRTLYASGPIVPFMATAYGRPGTAMGPYLDELDGPLTTEQVQELTMWLSAQAGVPPSAPSTDGLVPVIGDIDLGRQLYHEKCAECHGANGEGGQEVPGTALGNPAMLAMTPDAFLRLAIVEGREGTPMPPFKDEMSSTEIDAVTAFLRSRAEGWQAQRIPSTPPTPGEYVRNPNGQHARFELMQGRYVSAVELYEAVRDDQKLVLLDTRVPHFWAMAHIEGSIPIPYYSDFDSIVDDLPNDGTWIVAYCECPRAAADTVIDELRKRGFANTAVLWEGYGGWAALGYPIAVGRVPE